MEISLFQTIYLKLLIKTIDLCICTAEKYIHNVLTWDDKPFWVKCQHFKTVHTSYLCPKFLCEFD